MTDQAVAKVSKNPILQVVDGDGVLKYARMEMPYLGKPGFCYPLVSRIILTKVVIYTWCAS